MPEAVYSVLQVFPGLERTIREYLPRCEFYVGEDEKARQAQPPKIIWDINGGDPTGIEGKPPSNGRSDPRPFAADLVTISATCHGASAPSSATAEKTVRATEYASSEYIMCVLRWALKRSTTDGWLGAYEWLGWTTVWPEGPSDRSCPIECSFQVKVQILAPALSISEPPHTQTFQPIHLEA